MRAAAKITIEEGLPEPFQAHIVLPSALDESAGFNACPAWLCSCFGLILPWYSLILPTWNETILWQSILELYKLLFAYYKDSRLWSCLELWGDFILVYEQIWNSWNFGDCSWWTEYIFYNDTMRFLVLRGEMWVCSNMSPQKFCFEGFVLSAATVSSGHLGSD